MKLISSINNIDNVQYDDNDNNDNHYDNQQRSSSSSSIMINQQIEHAIDRMVSEAVERLSDESDEQQQQQQQQQMQQKKWQQHGHENSQRKFININDKNDAYILDDDDDCEDDINDDDNEKQQLLPKNRRKNAKIRSVNQQRINNNKNINDDVVDDDDDGANNALSQRHHQKQPMKTKQQKQRLLQQQQQQQQQHRQSKKSSPSDHRSRQPPFSNNIESCIDRANKFTAENNYTDIVNENIMGITPYLESSANNNNNENDSNNGSKTNVTGSNVECGPKFNWYIYLVTILSAIGGFLFGYDTGIVSGAMVFIRDYFNLSTTMQEVVISVTILTAWIFSFIAGYLTNKFGRKLTIILASFIFTIGGFLMALAHTQYVLLLGRAIVGLAIGLASMAIPVYIAEVAPVDIRGKLVSTNVCFITFGQFVASIVAGLFSYDPINGWRWMLGLASVPSILQMIFFFFLPESPRWLVQKGRYDDALNALRKFRTADTREDNIVIEFNNIKSSCLSSERERKNNTSISQILSNPTIMKALFVGSMLSIFQQIAGINTVMYYSATIIQMSGINDKSTAVWLSALTASINFIFSFVGLVLVERIGRRLLILSSLCGVVFSLFMLAIGFQLAEVNSPPITFHTDDPISDYCSRMANCDACVSSNICGFCFFDDHSNLLGSLSMSNINGTCLPMNQTSYLPFSNSSYCTNSTNISMHWTHEWCPSQYSWMTLAGLMLYLFFFAPGMGPMPWTINSEIYPLWARSFCYSVSTSFNWFFNLLVSLTFLTLTNLLTIYGAFYLYAGLAFFGLVMFFFILPETKGKKLEEIECLFQGSLFTMGLNKNLSQYDQVDGSVNASQSTVVTNASNESNAAVTGAGTVTII